MKKKEYEYSKTRKQLQNYKNRGKKEVIWQLSSRQKEILDSMGIRYEPWLYKIKTRPFFNIHKLPSILKEVHYKNKDGHNYYVRRLNGKDIGLLKEYNISFTAIKYKIHLWHNIFSEQL